MTIPGGGDNVVTEAEEIQAAMLCVVISIFCSSMGYIWTVDISHTKSVAELLTKVVRVTCSIPGPAIIYISLFLYSFLQSYVTTLFITEENKTSVSKNK